MMVRRLHRAAHLLAKMLAPNREKRRDYQE
jgi:hypothetical protein